MRENDGVDGEVHHDVLHIQNDFPAELIDDLTPHVYRQLSLPLVTRQEGFPGSGGTEIGKLELVELGETFQLECACDVGGGVDVVEGEGLRVMDNATFKLVSRLRAMD